MSKTSNAPNYLNYDLECVFREAIRKSGGEVVKFGTFDQKENEACRMEMEASFCDEHYYIQLKLVWTGRRYIVKTFFSIEAVDKMGELGKYIKAGQIITYELGIAPWYIRSSRNLIALFRAHNWWSNYWDFTPVFASFD